MEREATERWSCRGIPVDVRRRFVGSCVSLGLRPGMVLAKVMEGLTDIETLREFMDEELSIRDLMEDAEDAMKAPLADLPCLGDPFKGMPRF